MLRYIGIPLLAGTLASGLLGAGYWWYASISPVIETGAVAAEFLPDRTKVIGVTVRLQAHGNRLPVPSFELPYDQVQKVMNLIYSAKEIRARPGHALDELFYDGSDALIRAGAIQLYGEKVVDLSIFRAREHPERLSYFVLHDAAYVAHTFVFSAELEEAIRQACADYLEPLAGTAAAVLPRRVTSLTMKLDGIEDRSAGFDVPRGLTLQEFLRDLYRAKLVRSVDSRGDVLSDGDEPLSCVGWIRLYGWGERRVDWRENNFLGALAIYKHPRRSRLLYLQFQNCLFEADLEDAIRRAHAGSR